MSYGAGITGQVQVPLTIKLGGSRGFGKKRQVCVITQMRNGETTTTWLRPHDTIDMTINVKLV